MICCANQLTGFYMRATLALNGLRHTDDLILLILLLNRTPGPENSLCVFTTHILWRERAKTIKIVTATPFRSSHPEVLFWKGVLQICIKFTWEHPWRSVISIKLQLYWNRTSAWVFSHKSVAYFQNIFS